MIILCVHPWQSRGEDAARSRTWPPWLQFKAGDYVCGGPCKRIPQQDSIRPKMLATCQSTPSGREVEVQDRTLASRPPSSTLQNTKTKAVRSQVGGAPASQIWNKLSNKLIKHNSQESVEASKSLLINRWAAKKGSLC